MAEHKELSAIDAIYRILEKLESLDKRVNVLDSNLKLINNKLSKNNPTTISAGGLAVEGRRQDRERIHRDQDINKLVIGKVKVFGYIVNSSKIPIDGVEVNVYEEFSSLIKKAVTDQDGHWSVRLPPGRYSVEYSHENFKPIKKDIELNEEITKYEVR